MSFLEQLPKWLNRLGIDLSESKLDKLEKLCIRMTSDPLYPSVSKITDPEEIATKHILDSLAPLALDLPCWQALKAKISLKTPNSSRLADIGTGAGFPALPLAIAMPEVEVWAVDSKNKAIDFVKRMKEAVEVQNLKVCLARAEELGRKPNTRETFDLVVCRALAEIRVLLEYCLPLVRIGGYALFYKGPNLEVEMAETQKACQILGVRQNEISIYYLKPPALPFSRSFVLISKQRATPHAYPRRNGVPASKPL